MTTVANSKKNLYVDKYSFINNFNYYIKAETPFLFLIDFHMKNFFISPLDQLKTNQIMFNFNGISNFHNKQIDKKVELISTPVDYETYLKSFNIVQNHLKLGNSYLVNLTFPTEIYTNFSFDEIFYKSKALYKLKFYDHFIFFSPETFIKIIDGFIYTYPMKGTIDASLWNAEERILKDEKELAEHITIVDLLRNDLNMISTDVTVTKFRFISKIKSNNKDLLQVSSEIKGKLPPDYKNNLAEIILKLLPAGSISGAPKRKTVEIIKEAEIYDRGFYTGIAGIFDGKNIDSCVIIRFIERIDDKLIYKSGGGITIYSDPEKEYMELINKIYVPTC
ncbi:aminodeoxychorismate synthase component I [Deferribacter autotrophicus]|uniref:aminodeoxychorismate synthase component I n=1 Tax=Deferribacter autotrophicus TaxID=500465 RepID=UPI001CAA892F|nr:aminodeoxychorismate synthase component I [Deferribacter autotrophicus]